MKKGITPVVAVILLLLIVVSLVGGMFLWMRRTMGGIQQEVGNQTEQRTEQMGQTVRVENIDCDAGNVSIRNTGTNNIPAPKVQVWDNQDNGPVELDGTINAGDIQTVNLTSTYSGTLTATASAPGGKDSLTKTC